MEYLQTAGMRVPRLGLGTWQVQGRACRDAVARALELGYRLIDTAQMYENEREVGQGLGDSQLPRGEIFVVTKIWPDDLAGGLEPVERSLDALGLDRVDLLLVHWPSQEREPAAYLEPLAEAHERRLAKHVGVSNFTPGLLARALDLAPVACNQVEYHPFLDQRALRDLAREHDLLMMAYSPLAQGQVTRDDSLQRIGRAHGKTAAQVALRWLIQQEPVVPIPKASDREHLAENLAVFDFALDDEEMEAVAGLARGQRLIDPEFAPDWSR